ncbi:MAG: DNA-directed RNA polymerase subunit A'', partial [Candidatus Aenigmatarchaeota archaeon]
MTTIKIPKKIEDDFNKFCEEHKIKGSEKKKLYEKLKEIVKKSLFEPGEAVGVITAQSISEPATQMTMRSYTMASQAGRLAKVTFGLPRMVEIFDARKTFERAMKIYLKEEYNNKK